MNKIDEKRLEIGGDLYEKAKEAREWFIKNNVEIPNGAVAWQKASVRNGEIPPNCGIYSLRKLGLTARVFINLVKEIDLDLTKYKYSEINPDNSEKLVGLKLVDSKLIDSKGHKNHLCECVACKHTEWLNQGTLKRMLEAGNKYCRICRKAGGKPKPLQIYNKFKGFEAIEPPDSESKVTYLCLSCNSKIKRTITHIHTSDEIYCEICLPHKHILSSTKIDTDHGIFDSKIEYACYLKLVELLATLNIEIQRQVSYTLLFNTNTKHTADFYIPKLDLVLEITTKTQVLEVMQKLNLGSYKYLTK